MFGGSIYGQIFESIFTEGKRLKEEAIKERLGITYVDGFYGSDFLEIPYQYDYVSIDKNRIVFDVADSDKKDVYLIKENSTVLLFRCHSFNSLGENMYQVNQEKDGYCALFRNNERLTDYKYTQRRFDKWEEGAEFGVLHSKSPTRYSFSVVVNSKGEEIIENKGGLNDSIDLKGVVALVDGFWYNLLTLDKICSKSYYSTLESDEFIFIQCAKNSVYKINKSTGDFELFGIPDEKLKEKPVFVPIPKQKKTKTPATPKQNRNDACSCGSGLKFKKCCMIIKID